MSIEPYLNTSISYGTLRHEDLIPALYDVLHQLGKVNQEIKNEMVLFKLWQLKEEDNLDIYAANQIADTLDFIGEFDNEYDTQDTLDILFEYLEQAAPYGYYFGSHPGDGSDIGFWSSK